MYGTTGSEVGEGARSRGGVVGRHPNSCFANGRPVLGPPPTWRLGVHSRTALGRKGLRDARRFHDLGQSHPAPSRLPRSRWTRPQRSPPVPARGLSSPFSRGRPAFSTQRVRERAATATTVARRQKGRAARPDRDGRRDPGTGGRGAAVALVVQAGPSTPVPYESGTAAAGPEEQSPCTLEYLGGTSGMLSAKT